MRTMQQKVIWLLIILGLTLSTSQPALVDGDVNVYYVGPAGNVKTALKLAEFNLVEDPIQGVFLYLWLVRRLD
jgi:hypothetical protein